MCVCLRKWQFGPRYVPRQEEEEEPAETPTAPKKLSVSNFKPQIMDWGRNPATIHSQCAKNTSVHIVSIIVSGYSFVSPQASSRAEQSTG